MSEDNPSTHEKVVYVKHEASSLLGFIALLCFLVPWIMGIVLADTTTKKVVGVFMFPYAWYLTTERVMEKTGFLTPAECQGKKG